MPVDRVRQPRRKQQDTSGSNTSLATISESLVDLDSFSSSVLDDEDDLPPPLVEPPSDDMPPLVSNGLFLDIADFPPPGLGPPFQIHNHILLPPVGPEEACPTSPRMSDNPIFPEATHVPPSPSKPSHHKKRPADHIPRPPNAFILFRASFIKAQHIPESIEPNNNTLSRIIGLCWKSLPQKERDSWKEKARIATEEHKRLYPSYRYNPRDQQNRAQSAGRAKRKVKEIAGPPPDPGRCEEIARMLVEGKKGNELKDAVKELDIQAKASAPEPELAIVQTRFDQPMTERTFRRRSLSVPPLSKEDDTLPELPRPATKPRSRRSSRKRSQSTSVVKTESEADATPTKREEVRLGRLDFSPSTPFQFYAAASSSPSPSRQHMSAPQTPTITRASRVRRPGISHRSRPSSDNAASIFTMHTSTVLPLAATEPLFPVRPLDPSPIIVGADNGTSLFELPEPRQPHPVYPSTFSTLEGWDGIIPSNAARQQTELSAAVFTAGADAITSASNSPITPPFQFRYDGSQQPSPLPLSGHASEVLDSQWAYDAPIFELGTSVYPTVNTVALGVYGSHQFHRVETPCSPGVQRLAGDIHGLAISGEAPFPYDHRQRSISFDSGVAQQSHITPHLVHFSSQHNFKGE